MYAVPPLLLLFGCSGEDSSSHGTNSISVNHKYQLVEKEYTDSCIFEYHRLFGDYFLKAMRTNDKQKILLNCELDMCSVGKTRNGNSSLVNCKCIIDRVAKIYIDRSGPGFLVACGEETDATVCKRRFFVIIRGSEVVKIRGNYEPDSNVKLEDITKLVSRNTFAE